MTDHAHVHGSLGEEASRLADAVQDWLRSTAGSGARDFLATATEPTQDAAECRVCPVCQLLRVLRSTRPETFEHLTDAAASLAAALRGLVADASGPRPAPRPRDGVEHIDVDLG